MASIEQRTGELQHSYIPATKADREEMLEVIGVQSIDDLFDDIPLEHQINPDDLDLPAPLSEPELVEHCTELSSRNSAISPRSSFYEGKGAMHTIPAAVDHVTSKGGFHSSYSPYQAEVSQGTLMSMFIYQSYTSELTGGDIANAGMYDGSTAFAEGGLMAHRLTKRDKLVALGSVSPKIMGVIDLYTGERGLTLEQTSLDQEPTIDESVAAIMVQDTNHLGNFEDLPRLARIAHEVGALLVVNSPILSLVLRPESPCAQGANIVTGETQGLGIAPNFGGPHVGFFTAKTDGDFKDFSKVIRQMPGRIAGMTQDVDGKRAFATTFNTREQHIKREKATSNICTSQQLIAVKAAMAMTQAGSVGLQKMAYGSFQNANYAANQITSIPGIDMVSTGTGNFFNEFTVTSAIGANSLIELVRMQGLNMGVDVSSMVTNGIKLGFSELHRKEDIDLLTDTLKHIAIREGWEGWGL